MSRFRMLQVLVGVLLLLGTGAIAWRLGSTLHELVAGVFVGIVAAAVWTELDSLRRHTTHRALLRRLAGEYRVRKKGDHSPDAELGTVRLKVEGHRIRTQSDSRKGAGAWSGELHFGGANPESGAGQYHHTDADGWGFHTVQVRGTDLLVHSEYVRERQARVDGYVWERID